MPGPRPPTCGYSSARSNRRFSRGAQNKLRSPHPPSRQGVALVRVPSLQKELLGRQAHAQKARAESLASCGARSKQKGSWGVDTQTGRAWTYGSKDRICKSAIDLWKDGRMARLKPGRAGEGTWVEGPGLEYSRERPGSKPEGEGCLGSSALGTQGHGDDEDTAYLGKFYIHSVASAGLTGHLLFSL